MFFALLLSLALQDPNAGFPGTAARHRPKVEIAWNRLYDDVELYALFDRVEAAHPGFVRHEVIGHSVEGRQLRVYTIHNPATGADREKPAMWIDGNIHGNEVQGGEAALYAAWYLLENYGSNPEATELVDRAVLYVLPMVNPDGRASWFAKAHNASSSRTGVQPTDDDGDGLFDEDSPDDLDGDGQIVQMRKFVPGQGTHRQDPDDPRILVPVPGNDKGIRGDWLTLGGEGFDNDGDGRTNEDEVGGYDMNRAWPALWQPEHVQGGAGPYPLYWPETRAIARFVLDHPNIAAVQSFHNSGGMILRGPGVETYGEYPRDDVRVYDELGKDGERMLPFYRYMIIWKDLYSVFGGFVNWTYEGLGILSFTNEMWSTEQMFPDKAKNVDPGQNFLGNQSQKDRLFFDDTLLLGGGYVPWHAYDHPLYGRIEIGGFRKDVGRVPPTFLIEEMVHRNALFCVRHARALPLVTIEDAVVTDLGDGVRAIDVVFRNQRLIPTRTALAASKRIGQPDVYTCEGSRIEVLSGGFRTDRFRPERIQLAEREPARLVREDGVPGRGEVRVRWFVRGRGDRVTIRFQSEKARAVTLDLKIQ
ncbi:MAG: M14 family metallopeptidase [Planctomycetota bacterium]